MGFHLIYVILFVAESRDLHSQCSALFDTEKINDAEKVLADFRPRVPSLDYGDSKSFFFQKFLRPLEGTLLVFLFQVTSEVMLP